MSDEFNSIIVDPLLDNDANQEENLPVTEEVELDATPQPREPYNKYQGKSVDEIIEMHQNAERALGQKNNEIGQWREIVGSLANEPDEGFQEEPSQNIELSADDLFDNPTEAVSRLVQAEIDKRVTPIEQREAYSQIQHLQSQFDAVHPDAVAIANDPAFGQWATSSQYRVADAHEAINNGDLFAADRLLTEWKELNGRPPEAAPQATTVDPHAEGIRAAKAASTERGGTTGNVSSGTSFNATDIARLIRTDPSKYNSPEFQAELKQAIKEGRVKGL